MEQVRKLNEKQVNKTGRATPGVHFEHIATDQWWDVFVGSADALIAAGVVVRNELPGEPGRGTTMATYRADGSPVRQGQTTFTKEPGYRRIVRAGRLFRVFVTVAEHEQERRRRLFEAEFEETRESRVCEQRRQQRRREAAEHGMTEEQWALRGLPMSEADFRADIARSAGIGLNLIRRELVDHGEGLGFRYDAATCARFEVLAVAIDSLLERGDVLFDRERHARAIARHLDEAGVAPAPKRSRPTLRVVPRQ